MVGTMGMTMKIIFLMHGLLLYTQARYADGLSYHFLNYSILHHSRAPFPSVYVYCLLRQMCSFISELFSEAQYKTALDSNYLTYKLFIEKTQQLNKGVDTHIGGETHALSNSPHKCG